MSSMGFRAVLTVLLLFLSTVKAADGVGGVGFWKEHFTMTCPQNGSWYNKDNKEFHKGPTYTAKYENDKKGLYRCEYDNVKYYFYVQGKVCENCYELDAALFAVAIVIDVVGTVFVMMLVCMCTKKKSSAGFTHASKPPARSGGRPPPVPSPDYEPLSIQTRSQDTYSIVNRTG